MLFSYYNKDDDYVFFDYDSLKSSQVIAYNNRAQIIGDIYIHQTVLSQTVLL